MLSRAVMVLLNLLRRRKPEDGDYLALDLGGTNFRVILLRMVDGEVDAEKVKYFHVPEAVRLGSGERLFDFLATCILEFVVKENVAREKIPLGEIIRFILEFKF